MVLLARELTPRAIAQLASIMDDPDAPYRDQVSAAEILIERGCGKNPQAVLNVLGGDDAFTNMVDGEPMTPLIAAARRGEQGYEKELRAELARPGIHAGP